MAYKIKRNEAGNCITFEGSSNPVYWNGCLSAEVDNLDSNTVNVVNDIATAQGSGEKEYELYRIPFTDLVDKDGGAFASPQAAADYVNLVGNVSAPLDINVGYKGTYDASVGADPSYSSPVNGDWFYVDTQGTIAGVIYKINDIIKYDEDKAEAEAEAEAERLAKATE